MISFNGALTHIPDKKWDREQSVTIDKSYLIDVLKQEKVSKQTLLPVNIGKSFYYDGQSAEHQS